MWVKNLRFPHFSSLLLLVPISCIEGKVMVALLGLAVDVSCPRNYVEEFGNNSGGGVG